MVHYSEKDLINFATKKIDKDKIANIEKHLSECSQCSNEYDFLLLKLNLDSYIEYRKLKAQEQPSPCIKSDTIKQYAAGKILDKEKKKIEDHLICCEKCRTSFLNLDIINDHSLWTSIKDMTSETLNWIKDITFIPILDASLGIPMSAETQKPERIIAYTEDEIKIHMSSDKDSYLTIIHWNGEKLSLIFPNNNSSDTFIQPDKIKDLNIIIEGPAGIHQIKVFLTEEKLLSCEDIDFTNSNSVSKSIKEFTQKLEEIEENKWSQEMITYEVRELYN